tara:strand:- start:2384 stop:2635 length:252 start_codon:yes stop_codon:yes gene_type:complete
MKTFSDRVYEVVINIPRGETLSYAEVARKAGSPRAFRAVANLMAKNYNLAIPCHRVIRSNGELGGYNRGGVEAKKKLLINESN